MKILVTGGAGYIGSHVVKALAKTHHDLLILDNLSKGHKKSLLGQPLCVGDLKDRQFLDELFSSEKIDSVIHLAASSLVPESMREPAKYYENNVMASFNLLEAMRKHGTKNIVFSSTAAVYGEPDNIPITEDHQTKPTNPYGWTKLHFEEMLLDYDRAYGLKYISLRYFNAAGADPSGEIGEDHTPETHLIPIVLRQALDPATSLAIFGTDYPTKDGTCIRDYIHVNDLADAHLLALEALAAGVKSTVYNLGNNQGYSVRQVIEVVSKIVGKPIIAMEKPRRIGDPATLIASSDRIQKELNWQPKYPDLETIIATAWHWHKNHPNGYQE